MCMTCSVGSSILVSFIKRPGCLTGLDLREEIMDRALFA